MGLWEHHRDSNKPLSPGPPRWHFLEQLMEHDAHPLFSLSSLGFGFSGPSKKPLPPPPPCVEVHLSDVSEPINSHLDSVVINDELTLLKGRVNTCDVFGTSGSDLVPGKYEGGLKLWEGSIDLVNSLHSEVRDGWLSLLGKRVLELGCGHGLPGIYACLEGASVVHFQDFNAEVLKCLTIPNVKSNLAKDQCQSQNTSSDTKVNLSTEVHFFSGDWSEVHHLLFRGGNDKDQEGNQVSLEQDQCASYDVILMAETVYSLTSLGDLYGLIKKCLNHRNGVVYMAGKKHYFGVGGGTRQFIHVVNEDGVMTGSLLAEVADGSSNVREVWKLSFKSA